MRVLLTVALFLFSFAAHAQSTVVQSGTVTPGHAVRWISNGVVGDAGTAASGSLTSLGVTNGSGPGFCVNSGPITAAYNAFCLSASTTGGGVLSLDNYGGATGGFSIKLNGATQGLTTAILPTVADDLACFADTTGTIKECSGGSPWQTPAHSVVIGAGTGPTFNYALPPNYGALLAGTNNSTDPAFANIITGQNYGAAMTNTGEAYGYSFRNSTTTGTAIYSAINVSTPSVQDGLQSVMHIPSTATVGQSTGFSSYFQSDSAATNTVGYFAAGISTIANSPLWGVNTLLMDNATRATHARTGQILIGYEADFNVMGTATQVIGMSVGGNGLAQPTNAIGFIVNSLSGLSAGTYRWTTGFACLNATVVAGGNCLSIGTQQVSGTNSDSLYLSFEYWNAASVQKHARIYGTSGITGQGAIRVETNDTTSLLEVGYSGVSAGRLFLSGATSGGHLIISQATASGTITVPNATGTLVATASAPLSINSTTGDLSWTGLTQYGVIYANATTSVASTAAGTSTTLLHGNASGAPTWSAVVSADLNITTTSCTNQFVTAISSGGVGTCTTDTLASAQHANQGTTTTFLRGNAAGNPSWSQVAISTDVSGLGTSVATALGVNVGTAGAFVVNGGALGSPSSAGTMPAFTLGGTVSGGGNQINNVIIGTSTPLAGTFTALTANTSFTMTSSVTYSSASTNMITLSPTITNNSAGDMLVFVNATFNGNGNSPTGYASVPQFTPSGSIAEVNSGVFGGYLGPGSTVTITDAYASSVYWQFLNTAGAVTNAHALYVKAPVIFGSLKPGTSYGVHVANQGISGVTNTYGIYVDAQSGSTNNYALDIEGGLSKVVLTTDATHTDRTVCQDTTSSVLYYGSGTAGICLGTSGRQFKTEFSPMTVGLAEVAKLNLQNYRYRKGYGDDGASIQYGMTAQDVEAVLPGLVRHDARGNAINYDIGALWFIALRAIQELNAANDNLKSEVEKLKHKL